MGPPLNPFGDLRLNRNAELGRTGCDLRLPSICERPLNLKPTLRLHTKKTHRRPAQDLVDVRTETEVYNYTGTPTGRTSSGLDIGRSVTYAVSTSDGSVDDTHPGLEPREDDPTGIWTTVGATGPPWDPHGTYPDDHLGRRGIPRGHQ